MTKQLSFTKQSNKVLPGFRQKTNLAESSEDVKKFFAYSVQELLENVFTGTIHFDYGDIALTPDTPPYYAVKETVLSDEHFASIWQGSDLPHLIARMAETAQNRYTHLEKHPDKTDAKIRM
jgi:hypothetical protein